MTTAFHARRSGLLWVLGYFAATVSVVLAVKFAYTNADTTLDALIRSAAAGVAALVGCYGPAWIYRSLHLRAWGPAFIASLAFAICLAVTLAGGIGTIATGTDKTLAARANATTTYDEWRKELQNLRDKRLALPASRPEGTVEGHMTAARVDRRWTSSSECSDATVTASRTFCAEYARLQAELATAKQTTRLDEKIGELTLKLQTAPPVRAANPQAVVIARVLHVSIEDAEAWYAFLFALSVEFAAMSVLLIAETTTHRQVTARLAKAELQQQRPAGGWRRALPPPMIESRPVIHELTVVPDPDYIADLELRGKRDSK